MKRTRLVADDASSRALAWLGTELVRRQEHDGEHEVIAVFIEEEVLSMSTAARDQVDRLFREGRKVNIIATVRMIGTPPKIDRLYTDTCNWFEPPLSASPLTLDETKQLIDGMMLDINDRLYGKKKGRQ